MGSKSSGGGRCPRCQARNNCGWSSVMPDPNINPEMLYLKPCENLCAPFSFRENIDLVDWGGVCRLFEEATIYEIASKTGTAIREVRSRYRRRRD